MSGSFFIQVQDKIKKQTAFMHLQPGPNATPGEVSIEVLSAHKLNQQGGGQQRGTTLTASIYDGRHGGKDSTSLSWAGDGGTLVLPAPVSTYQSIRTQSFHSLPKQVALPSASSSARRGGLKGLRVRNKKWGNLEKQQLFQRPHMRGWTLHERQSSKKHFRPAKLETIQLVTDKTGSVDQLCIFNLTGCASIGFSVEFGVVKFWS